MITKAANFCLWEICPLGFTEVCLNCFHIVLAGVNVWFFCFQSSVYFSPFSIILVLLFLRLLISWFLSCQIFLSRGRLRNIERRCCDVIAYCKRTPLFKHCHHQSQSRRKRRKKIKALQKKNLWHKISPRWALILLISVCFYIEWNWIRVSIYFL